MIYFNSTQAMEMELEDLYFAKGWAPEFGLNLKEQGIHIQATVLFFWKNRRRSFETFAREPVKQGK